MQSQIINEICSHFHSAKAESMKTGVTIYDVLLENVSNTAELKEETESIQKQFDQHNLEMSLSIDGKIEVKLNYCL